VTETADLVKKGSAEFVYEAERETGEVTRLVFRKIADKPKRKAKD